MVGRLFVIFTVVLYDPFFIRLKKMDQIWGDLLLKAELDKGAYFF